MRKHPANDAEKANGSSSSRPIINGREADHGESSGTSAKTAGMKTEKLFIIKKTLMAKDVSEALRKEKKANVDEVFVDPDWARMMMQEPSQKPIGFNKK